MRRQARLAPVRSFVALVVIALLVGGWAQAGAARSQTDPVIPVAAEAGGGAKAVEEFKANPGVFDPDGTGCPVAEWKKNAGLRDRKQQTSFGLVLQKNCPTATNAAAGADITGEKGIVLTQLGFDFKGDCGAGAPRFNVYTASDFSRGYFVGCASGAGTPVKDGFTRVRFQEEDFVPFGGADPFRFSNTQVFALQIIVDEGPTKVVLDNIAINNQVIQQP